MHSSCESFALFAGGAPANQEVKNKQVQAQSITMKRKRPLEGEQYVWLYLHIFPCLDCQKTQ